MIDPILSISFSMHSNKGVYALLLGSGISRSASIPTGWEVTLDLIRKLAHLKNENCEPNPAKWYEETFSEEADYSKILNQVAKTSSERNQLLKSYFEPTEDERQQNIKTPTIAHKAIANLVKEGYIRVIITTNFDRLMEKALEDVGVIPLVISTTDAINGATPITHTACTIIKLHGDYLDTRIKNTPDELSQYDKQINLLLDRIFDEFGLIISGWSGDWDTALRKAIQRCKSRRFTTYWTIKDKLSDKAKEVATFRKAEFIEIQSADTFFEELNEKLLAISEFERPHPLSTQAAIAMFKKYLEEDKFKIRLHDLFKAETEKLHENISTKNFPTGINYSKEELLRRTQRYQALAEIIQAMMITGGYWGNSNVEAMFVKTIERLSDYLQERNGLNVWVNLRLYPVLLLLFSTGLSALASENYSLLSSILIKPQNKYSDRGGSEPLILSLYPHAVLEQATGRELPGMERRHTPTSDHLVDVLESSLREYYPNKNDFEDAFDRFEFFISMTIADIKLQISNGGWVPTGRYGWRRRYENSIATQIKKEINQEGVDWKPIKAGFFGNSLERANKALEAVIDALSRNPYW